MLNPESATPLYLQLKSHLQTQIEEGVYGKDGRLPSERELAQQYNISRMTARQAIQALMQDGFIDTRVGKGTYVREQRIDQDLRHLTSFTEDMQRRGRTADSRVIRVEKIRADADIAAHLKVLTDTQVGMLSRLRLADGEPLAWEICHLNLRLCPDILDRYDFSSESLYRVLREVYGQRLVSAQQVITARMPSREERDLLHITEGIPVLALHRVTHNDALQPVEYVQSVYRGDRYQLQTTLNLYAPTERGSET
ncbi:MAG: GntR family transcriptional regulator [Anaerolineae bacterium]|nr:GntR family transcriptional regulator [Anaerolineae bacterium]